MNSNKAKTDPRPLSAFWPVRAQMKTQAMLSGAFLLLVLLAIGLVYFSLSSYSHNDFYRLLTLRANTAAEAFMEESKSDADIMLNKDQLLDENDFIIPLKRDTDFARQALKLGVPLSFFEELLNVGEAQYHYKEIFYKGILFNHLDDSFIVVVRAENYYESHHFAFLQRVLVATLVIGLILSTLIASFLSDTIFKPLRQITLKVNQISSESLHLRMDETYSNDELSALVKTFNNMLDRIETSFETQNNFISNASHEFRTPLTAIIGEADVALAKERSQQEYVDTMRIILQEAEKLDKKTQALLFLAQTGFHGKSLKGDVLRIDQLLWDTKETIHNINPKGQVNFDMRKFPENPSLLKVHGNEQLLHLAFSNIINNACKYSDNIPVNICIQVIADKIHVTIEDNGIGIPSEELRYIYDPFFRASNTEPYEGYGIGMPLSRNIIRMHQGEIVVTSEEYKGTKVTIILPTYEGKE